MILRSSTNLQKKNTSEVKLNSFVELRTYDVTSKPWLARVVNERTVVHASEEKVTEIECEWLWHAQDAIHELGIEGVESDIYGSREVFLTSNSCESLRDWNPLESVKWEVYVFSLEKYRQVVAGQYKACLLENRSLTSPLDPNRCWYYRQVCHPEKRILEPVLPLVIHCPNPLFHEWCRTHHKSPQDPLSNKPDSNGDIPPPRTICVPENPERLYYQCTICYRRFKTQHGDCPPDTVTSSSTDSEIELPVCYKSQINQSDISFNCPMCHFSSQALKDTQSSSQSFAPIQAEDSLFETNKKSTRFTRFNEVFAKAISESLSDPTIQKSLKFTDSTVLCSHFFQHFNSYVEKNKLSSKMMHQKIHEIFQNLKRENNVALRRRIVIGELSLNELLDLDAKELAPESVKRRRELEAEKYFKQQILLDSETAENKLIRKTHKGLEPVQDDFDGCLFPNTSTKSLEDNSVCNASPQTDANEAFNHFRLDGSLEEDTLSKILQGFKKHKECETELETSLKSLNNSIDVLWKNSLEKYKQSPLLQPPSHTGIPSRSETMQLLTVQLSSLVGDDISFLKNNDTSSKVEMRMPTEK